MLPRVASALACLVLVAAVAVGCVPEPEPSPTPPVFASEEEAFAAAEETYRAYVDALNQVDLSDPETFEAVYAWTTGEANAADRKSFSQMNADGWTVSGMSRATVVESVHSTTSNLSSPQLAICLDVSEVVVTDAEGVSVVQADRGQFQSMLVTFESATTPTGLAISRFEGREGDPLCST